MGGGLIANADLHGLADGLQRLDLALGDARARTEMRDELGWRVGAFRDDDVHALHDHLVLHYAEQDLLARRHGGAAADVGAGRARDDRDVAAEELGRVHLDQAAVEHAVRRL